MFVKKGLICSALSTDVEGRGVRDEGRGVRGWKEKSKIKVENVERKVIPGHRVVIEILFAGRGHPDFEAFALGGVFETLVSSC